MTDRRRRSEKLVQNIRSALERGVDADRIHAELVRRNVPPDKATRLLDGIVASMGASAHVGGGQPAFEEAASADSPPAFMTSSRRRRTPFFLALGLTLVLGGFTGALLTGGDEPQPDTGEAERVTRLEADVEAARSHLAHLEERIDARRVDAEQVEWLRARVARGPHTFETDQEYSEMVARYERRRARWNRTLSDYQVVAQAFRTLADIHNAKADSLEALTRAGAGGAGAGTGAVRRISIVAANP